MTLSLDFQGKILKLLYLRNGRVVSLGMKGMLVGNADGCTMGLALGDGSWQIDQPSNGSMWNSYSFQPVGQWMGYLFTDLWAEGCCHSVNALFLAGGKHYQNRMWNMISSSPATPTVSWAEIWEFSKSQRDIIDAVTISKVIVFEIICNVAYYSAAKFTFPIEQPSNKATKCGIRWSGKLEVKPNHGCCSYIAITISYISVFVSSCQSQDWKSFGRLSAKVTQ